MKLLRIAGSIGMLVVAVLCDVPKYTWDPFNVLPWATVEQWRTVRKELGSIA